MKLTEHFTLWEFEYSTTARLHDIDNSVPAELIPSIRNLCEQVLEPLRQHVREPVIISSGYRCEELNRLLGGVANSQHIKGEAADLFLDDSRKLRRWYNWMNAHLPYDQLIMERKGTHRWIHVSCRTDSSQNRHQALVLTVNS